MHHLSGKLAESHVTGVQGVVIATCTHINGMTQLVMRTIDSDNGLPKDSLFDESDLFQISEHEKFTEFTPIPTRPHSIRPGDKVKCSTHNLEGLVVEVFESIFGSIDIMVGVKGADLKNNIFSTQPEMLTLVGEKFEPKSKETGCMRKLPSKVKF